MNMRITPNHFGGHALATIHPPDPGGPLERFLDEMPFTSLRFPGGTITERIAWDGRWHELFGEPNNLGSQDRLVTVREIQEFADGRDMTIQFVLPSFWLLDGAPRGQRMVDQDRLDELMGNVRAMLQGEHGPMVIEHFSIGNEWWSGDPRFGDLVMTATEYGRIVNAVLEVLPGIIEETVGRENGPQIAVQAGVGFRPNSNAEILREISIENRGEIDAVVQHFYPNTHDTAGARQLLFDLARQMASAEGMDNPDFLVSEWNIQASSDGDRGMLQATALPEVFDVMLRNGVTDANFWGTNYRFLETRLAEMSHNHWEGVAPEDVRITLTPAGHVFRIMARELPGSRISDLQVEDILLDDSDVEELRLNSYDSDDRSTMLLSFRGDGERSVRLDLDAIAPDGAHVWARVFEAVDDPTTLRNESAFDSQHARAQFRTLNRDQLEQDPEIALGPGGFVAISVTRNPSIGTWMEGDHQMISPGFDFDDTLIGTSGHDKIRGGLGNDTLLGGDGRDVLVSGVGRSTLDGQGDEDLLISNGLHDVAALGRGDVLVARGQMVEASVEGDHASIFALSGEVSLDLSGSALIAVGGDAQVSISGFNPFRDMLVLSGEPEDDVAWRAGAKADGDDLVLSWSSASARLVGMAGRKDEVMMNRFAGRDEDEVNETLDAHLGGLTRFQRLALDREVGDDPLLEDLLASAPELPEDEDGYGRRLSWEDDEPDDPDGAGAPLVRDRNPRRDRDREDQEDDDTEEDPARPEASGGCMVVDGLFLGKETWQAAVLRRYRETVLRPSRIGRAVISAYLALCPVGVPVLVRSPILRAIGHAALVPAVWWAGRRCAAGPDLAV